MENRARWIGNNLEFSEPTRTFNLFIFGLFCTLSWCKLLAFFTLLICELSVVFTSSRPRNVSWPAAWRLISGHIERKPKGCHSTKSPQRRISVFPLAGEIPGPATTYTCLFLMLRIYNHHRSSTNPKHLHHLSDTCKKVPHECRVMVLMRELTLTSIIIHLGDCGSTWQSIYRVRWTCDNNKLGIMAIFVWRWMVPSMFPTCTYNAQAVKTMISVPLN